MNISDEHQTDAPENNQQEPRGAAAPPRHADWISYATAMTQQATPGPADFLSDSEF